MDKNYKKYERGYVLGEQVARELMEQLRKARKALKGRDALAGFDDAVRDSEMANS